MEYRILGYKTVLDDLDKPLKETLAKTDSAYEMFSPEHIQAIVDLVNKDEFIAAKGKELDLTVKLAIKLNGSDKVYKFSFEKGRIVSLDFDSDAPFVISADSGVWQEVFLGKLDSFVAVTQGRMKFLIKDGDFFSHSPNGRKIPLMQMKEEFYVWLDGQDIACKPGSFRNKNHRDTALCRSIYRWTRHCLKNLLGDRTT